jgi:hypothetical protein
MCLFLETLVVNTSALLFQSMLNIDCSRLGMRLDRFHDEMVRLSEQTSIILGY